MRLTCLRLHIFGNSTLVQLCRRRLPQHPNWSYQLHADNLLRKGNDLAGKGRKFLSSDFGLVLSVSKLFETFSALAQLLQFFERHIVLFLSRKKPSKLSKTCRAWASA